VAETSFYRVLFFVEAPGMKLPSSAVEHSVFSVRCRVEWAVDLHQPPFDRDAETWRHPTDYARCQEIADAAREAGIGAIRYSSVRDSGGGMNCALLSPAGFADNRPRREQTWHIFPSAQRVRAWCESPPQSLEFRREDFHDPRLSG
jgi:hypothetical protein